MDSETAIGLVATTLVIGFLMLVAVSIVIPLLGSITEDSDEDDEK